jgi:hypothetical protein
VRKLLGVVFIVGAAQMAMPGVTVRELFVTALLFIGLMVLIPSRTPEASHDR